MARTYLARLLIPERTYDPTKAKPETRLSIEFSIRLRALSLEGRLKAVWTHVPNEIGWGRTNTHRLVYAIAKSMGMIVGSPDYVFLGAHGSLALEAKRPKGIQSPAQKDFESWCHEHGVPYRIFHAPEEGIAILREYGFISTKPNPA